jgi:phage shock protein A
MAIQRAEDKTAQMQARAGAIDELMASGALDDAVGGRRDDIQSELDMMSASSDVERELAMLKGELTAGAPKQLEGGAQNGAGQGTQANQAPQQSQEQGPYAPPAPPQQYAPPQQTDQKQQTQQNQQAQPAGLPVSDLPGLQDEPQDGDRS